MTTTELKREKERIYINVNHKIFIVQEGRWTKKYLQFHKMTNFWHPPPPPQKNRFLSLVGPDNFV